MMTALRKWWMQEFNIVVRVVLYFQNLEKCLLFYRKGESTLHSWKGLWRSQEWQSHHYKQNYQLKRRKESKPFSRLVGSSETSAIPCCPVCWIPIILHQHDRACSLAFLEGTTKGRSCLYQIKWQHQSILCIIFAHWEDFAANLPSVDMEGQDHLDPDPSWDKQRVYSRTSCIEIDQGSI